MSSFEPIDIAKAINMSHKQFAQLTQRGKIYYFHLVHYRPNCEHIQLIEYKLRHQQML